MATIVITTTKEEQSKVLVVLKKLQGQTVPLSKVAMEAGIPENRVRYIVYDLIDAGRVKRIPTKATCKHYVRYTYEVVDAAQ